LTRKKNRKEKKLFKKSKEKNRIMMIFEQKFVKTKS